MKRKSWGVEEDEYIRENYGKLTYADMGRHLGRTAWDVKYRATGLELVRGGGFANNARDEAEMRRWRDG